MQLDLHAFTTNLVRNIITVTKCTSFTNICIVPMVSLKYVSYGYLGSVVAMVTRATSVYMFNHTYIVN